MIFISCKNKSKTKTATETKNRIDQSVYEMWSGYIESNPELKDEEIPESDLFHNNK
ncbi:hypothetical protein [uncultured Maribacter sp.]|uniref:hypothetical protein n=1 Tax=uncultured Maribacter sp. TaxID=431308 RepID=UPI0030DBC536|tara:strand:- start:4465 stop:4632 length:168 start_codon:yes stop_codon:yes gene_type:complete